MRNQMTAFALAAALSIGSAQAAPGFGPSSHRLGGSATKASEERPAQPLLKYLIELFRVDFSASIEPVAGEPYPGRASNSKECDASKKSEVAKADTKDEPEGGSSKGRPRPNEPVYLAF